MKWGKKRWKKKSEQNTKMLEEKVKYMRKIAKGPGVEKWKYTVLGSYTLCTVV